MRHQDNENRPDRDGQRDSEAGFTLTEVLVTMAIIGLLAGGVALAVLPRLGDANITRARTDITQYETALGMFELDHFRKPTEQEGLDALITPPPGIDAAKFQQGGYMTRQRLTMDPWGNPYIYRNPGRNGAYDILSYGADGQEGGEGVNADIGNWQL